MADLLPNEKGEKSSGTNQDTSINGWKSKIASWYETAQPWLKKIALGIVVFLGWCIIDDVKYMYTDMAAINKNIVRLYFIVVLTSYCIGGLPYLTRVLAFGALLILLPSVYLQMTGKNIRENLEEKRIMQEKIVTFKPGEPSNSGLIAQIGDTVQYLNPTAPFKVPGKEQFHPISSTTEHTASGNGNIVIYGTEKEGYVQIKVIPKKT